MNNNRWLLVFMLAVGVAAGAFLSKYVEIGKTAAESGPVDAANDAAALKALLKENASNLNAFSIVSKLVSPSVVNISAVVPAGRSIVIDPFRGFNEEELSNTQAGSGVIVSSDGYILTNNHVVQNSNKVFVTLHDKRDYEGVVVGTDKETDLAVVKISAPNLQAAMIGDSDHIQVGEWVIAIGNPFALNNTITAGIISATGRGGVGLAPYEGYIQTDAAINPGNSGGPLLNLEGKVIGINTAIMSRTGSNQGIGFAIPINRANFVYERLVFDGKVSRGYLGVQTLNFDRQLVDYVNKQYQMSFKNTQDLLDFLKMREIKGVFIASVLKGSPADEAKVAEGDILLEYNGRPINTSYELQDIVAMTSPKASVPLKIIRDGKTMEVTAKVALRPGK